MRVQLISSTRLHVRSSSALARLGQGMALFAMLGLAVACSSEKPAAPAAAGGAAANSMFQDPAKAKRPQGPPDEGGAAPAGGAAGGAPAVNPFDQKSPACKAIEEQQAALRAQVNQQMETIVGPASSKAEEAYDAFQECQDDAGCLSDVTRYQARQSAYASAKRAAEASEGEVEKLETQLHALSEQYAAKCDTDPL